MPQRIQLSRRAGFRLQEWSRELNGLPAQKIDRTTRYGNPFRIGLTPDRAVAQRWGWTLSPSAAVVVDAHDAVQRFAKCLLWDEAIHDDLRLALGGKNLGCWCGTGEPCHGRPLIFVANSIPSDIYAIHARIDAAILAAGDDGERALRAEPDIIAELCR